MKLALFVGCVLLAAGTWASDADRVFELLRADRWEEALALAERLDDPGALAAAELRAGRLSSALGRLEAADAADGRASAVRARLEAARGRVDQADAFAKQAVAAAPDEGDVLYWAADVVSDRALAEAWLRRFVEQASAGQPEARVESARGALATLARAGELGRARWVAERLPERLELPLTALPDGRGSLRGWTISARLGKRKRRARLLLDSGTHGLTLVRRVADRGGLTELAERELVDVSGRVQATRGVIPRLALGELVYRDAWVTAVSDELDPTGGFSGLVGISLFSGYRVTLDPRAGRLVAERGLPAATGGMTYWWVAGHPLVEVDVEGVGTRLFVFDTGAARSVLAAEMVERSERLTVTGATRRARTVGGESSVGVVRDVALAAGAARYSGATLSAPFAASSAAAGVEISGLLGLDVYGECSVRIDGVGQSLDFDCR